MRKFIIFGAISLSLVFLLSVYAIPPGSPTWIVQLRAPHGLEAGDAVKESGQRIGQVVTVEPRSKTPGRKNVDVLITIDPGFRDRVRERATFLVTTPAGSTRPVLSLVVFDESSPVLPPGSQLIGAESEMEVEIRRQMLVMEGTVRELAMRLDALSRSLDKASRSEEKRQLEESVGSLFETLQRTRDDVARVLTQEIERWKRISEKLFPPEREKSIRFVS